MRKIFLQIIMITCCLPLASQETVTTEAEIEVRTVDVLLPFQERNKEVNVTVIENQGFIDGDIYVGYVPPAGYISSVDQSQRAVSVNQSRFIWPNNIVPYLIQPNHPSQFIIEQAINEIESLTNVNFMLRQHDEPDFVRFEVRDGCWSQVGRQGGMQIISIGVGCGTKGIVMHEVLHTLGLWHEQSRADRNNFIRVNWNNIMPNMRHNFDQHIDDGMDIGSYNVFSIMHYGPYAFSVNGNPTISCNQGIDCSQLGQRTSLGRGDIDAINLLYPGEKVESKLSSPVFVGHYYLRKHVDVARAGMSAVDHWSQFGMTEGRQSSPVFDPKYYLNRYSDLRNAFGTDYQAATNHFIEYGINEGRQGSADFDPRWYLDNNEDLKNTFGFNFLKAMEHFVEYGIIEGRQGAPGKSVDPYMVTNFFVKEYEPIIFHRDYYLNRHPDVRDSGMDPWDHWIQYGINEGRASSPTFDLRFYAEKYADVRNAYGDNYRKILNHFLVFGINEGRIGSREFDWRFYASRNEDVAAAYGRHRYPSLMNHFIEFGINEGRQGANGITVPVSMIR